MNQGSTRFDVKRSSYVILPSSEHRTLTGLVVLHSLKVFDGKLRDSEVPRN